MLIIVFMKNQIVRCNVGIDVSKADFNACILTVSDNNLYSNLGTAVFVNSKTGFKDFIKWCDKTLSFENKTFTLEFTGRYSDKLAHFLVEQKFNIHLVSPFKSKRYRESYDADIKTDKTDAYMLALMAIERQLPIWKPDSEFFANLKIIVRERYGLVKQKTQIKNKIHALKFANSDTAPTIKRFKEQLKLIRKQISVIGIQIENYLKTDEIVWKKVENVLTIPGVGLTTIATVLVETDGFQKVESAKKLSAFAGYKVTIKKSGQYEAKPHISKRGNKFIRHALHMPTLCMIQRNPLLKQKYKALKARKSKPIIATTAIERKALILMYSIYKNNTTFNAEHQKSIKL